MNPENARNTHTCTERETEREKYQNDRHEENFPQRLCTRSHTINSMFDLEF